MSSTHPHVRIVLTTLGADTDGAVLARTLVDERLAACVNVLPPMTSVLSMEGQVEQDRRAAGDHQNDAGEASGPGGAVRGLHSYELPEFVVLAAVSGSDAYCGGLESRSAPHKGAAPKGCPKRGDP